MLPRTAKDWTLDIITDILATKVFETEDFDFKQMLPRDPKGKERLRAACCAFANSDGGFLIFGVSDDRSLGLNDRLTGISAAEDFPEQFGNQPKLCVPSVYWTFRQPPIVLPSGNLIHVVHIPKSWKAPHAVGQADDGWRFPKRTNKGDEGMSFEEIRSAFLNYYEKRLRLQLLRSELQAIKILAAEEMLPAAEQQSGTYSLVTFDAAVVDAVIADTYPLTAPEPEFLDAIIQLRQVLRVANNKATTFFSAVELPLTNKLQMVQQHNHFMRKLYGKIVHQCDRAQTALDRILQP